MEALLPLTVCLQGVGEKTRVLHCEPALHLPAVSSPLQPTSTLIYEYYNLYPVLLDKNSEV